MATEKSRILKSLRSGNGAGRIKRDDKGETVWEWDTDGEEAEETSVLVGRLHNNDLALVEDTPDPENEAGAAVSILTAKTETAFTRSLRHT